MSEYDYYIGVPYSGVEKDVERIDIIGTREDECLAIGAGMVLSGKKPLVFMQNSGLGNSIDVITSLLIPYEIDIDMIINNRTEPEHHAFMGEITTKLLDLLGYE